MVAIEVVLIAALLGLGLFHLYQMQSERDRAQIEETQADEADDSKDAKDKDDDKWYQVKNTSPENDKLESGKLHQDGFVVDNTLYTAVGDIHYSSYVPAGYDGSESYALFVTLPGYGGLYFQGVGANLEEPFANEAKNYNDKMIILSLQHEGWGDASANMTIELTEYYMANYNIDPNRVYLEGYAEGGETGSIVMEKRPELYTAFLIISSKWDGNIRSVAGTQTPVYFMIGGDDNYAEDDSESLTTVYQKLAQLYIDQGLGTEEIGRLAVLDIKDSSYFSAYGYSDSHSGGKAAASDPAVMGWLFGEH